jgi:hypothetical protein
MITLRHYGRRHTILVVAMIHDNVQQVGINPEYNGYLAQLTRHKLEIK